eukprot:6016686-Heterocapsa_arctica.AAC.1
MPPRQFHGGRQHLPSDADGEVVGAGAATRCDLGVPDAQHGGVPQPSAHRAVGPGSRGIHPHLRAGVAAGLGLLVPSLCPPRDG